MSKSVQKTSNVPTPKAENKASQLTPEQEKLVSQVTPEGAPEAAVMAAEVAVQEGTNPVIAVQAALKAEQAATPGIGHNQPTGLGALRIEIQENYKPTIKGEEAILNDLREATLQVQTTTNEIEGSQTSRLANDYADLAFERINATPPMPITSTFAEDLVAYVRSKNIFGDPKTLVSKTKVDLSEDDKAFDNEIAENVDPWSDRNLAAKHKDAAMKAALLVINVARFGYIRKDQVSGKRFTREMVFLRENQIEGEIGAYHRVICVPMAAVNPYRWKVKRDPDDVGNNKVIVLEPGEPRTNNNLHYLTSDWAYALYQNRYNKQPLTYDVGPTENGIPASGFLLRSAPMQRTPRVTKADEFQPKSLEDFKNATPEVQWEAFKAVQAREAEARQAIGVGNPTADTFLTYVNQLAEITKDSKFMARLSPTQLAVTARVGMGCFAELRRKYDRNLPPAELHPVLRQLARFVEERMSWNETVGEYEWLASNGNSCGLVKGGNGQKEAA